VEDDFEFLVWLSAWWYISQLLIVVIKRTLLHVLPCDFFSHFCHCDAICYDLSPEPHSPVDQSCLPVLDWPTQVYTLDVNFQVKFQKCKSDHNLPHL
jgi:hypothetical protein